MSTNFPWGFKLNTDEKDGYFTHKISDIEDIITQEIAPDLKNNSIINKINNQSTHRLTHDDMIEILLEKNKSLILNVTLPESDTSASITLYNEDPGYNSSDPGYNSSDAGSRKKRTKRKKNNRRNKPISKKRTHKRSSRKNIRTRKHR